MRVLFKSGAVASTIVLSSTCILLQPGEAQADDCLLDTNNDGDVTAGGTPDTDLGADSAGANSRVACGDRADAEADAAVAIGGYFELRDEFNVLLEAGSATAGEGGVAIGSIADADEAAVAIGFSSDTGGGTGGVAVGYDAFSFGDSAVAVGAFAWSLGQHSIAIGEGSRAYDSVNDFLVLDAVAIGYQAEARSSQGIALGASSLVGDAAIGAIAIGSDSTDLDALGAIALASDAIAFGSDAVVGLGAVDGVAIGRGASALDTVSAAIGSGAIADGNGAIAVGQVAFSQGQFSTAVGQNSRAEAIGALAFGAGSVASSQNSMALGNNATATGESGLAIGRLASAGFEATASGFNSSASGNRSVALASNAIASASNSVALGTFSTASATGAVSIGVNSDATALNGVAIGATAQATHTGSTALGTGATTTAANQVTLGGSGSSVRIGDIAASTAAQQGPVEAVTVDASGTLGTTAVASAQAVASLDTSMRRIASFHDAQFAALEGRVTALDFRLDDLDESTRGGIAAAMALGGQMIVPDSAISISVNGSTYRGEQGFAGSVSARITPRVYLSGGVAGSTAKNSTGARVGIAVGF